MIEAKAVAQPRRGMLRNLITLYTAQIATSLLSLIPIAFVPAYLGVVGMGRLTFAISFTGLMSTLIVIGTTPYIVREIARDNDCVSEIVSSGVLLRAGLSLILLPFAVAIVYLLGYPSQTQTVVLIAYVGLSLRMVSYTFASALQALEDMTWRSVAVVTKEAVAVSIGWLVLWRGGGIVGYILVLTLADIVELCLNVSYFVFIVPIRAVIRGPTIVSMFRGGLPFFLWAFLQTIYIQASSLTLSKIGGEAAVGWFGTANLFVTPLLTIPSVAITVLLPRLSQLHVLEPAAFRRVVTRATNYMSIIMMPLAFGLFATAEHVIGLFKYGPRFHPAIPVLQVLAFNLPATALLMVMATTVSAVNKERRWARISLFSVVAIIALNFVLIPLTSTYLSNAAIGGSLADLITELLTLTLTLRLLGRGSVDSAIFVTLGKTILAGGLMAIVVMWARWLPLPVAIPLGALIYIGSILCLKTLPSEELSSIGMVVAKRWPRAGAALRILFNQGIEIDSSSEMP